MKKILFIACANLFIAIDCFSQAAEKPNYMQKSKNQKTAAWILLGGGVGVSVIGLTQINVAGSDNGSVNNTPGSLLLATGLAASLTSIPLFIASQKNKKRSLSVSFKTEKMQQLIKNNYIYIPATSFNLNIKL